MGAVVESRLREGTGPLELVLRRRSCHAGECSRIFYICRHCDRGQRYCSRSCRALARWRQLREANRRHQQSPAGRLDHRDHQRAYRCRQATKSVTYQGSKTLDADASITGSKPIDGKPIRLRAETKSAIACNSRGLVAGCIICGRAGTPPTAAPSRSTNQRRCGTAITLRN
jgi:hypothetical protein